MSNLEFVTDKQWLGVARRLEKKNLKKVGESLTYTGIARAANYFIVETQSDRGGMLVEKGWREAMQNAARKV